MSNNYSVTDISVIDLTDSLILADHCALSNAIINLDTDESFYIDSSIENQENSEINSKVLLSTKQKRVQRKKSLKKKKLTPQNPEIEKNKLSTSKFGDCAICLDELGNNPLASTKCGHVFCIKCLKQTIQIDKKCPTCRTILKGSSAYHPLYLN